jgi:hypothetical protein
MCISIQWFKESRMLETSIVSQMACCQLVSKIFKLMQSSQNIGYMLIVGFKHLLKFYELQGTFTHEFFILLDILLKKWVKFWQIPSMIGTYTWCEIVNLSLLIWVNSNVLFKTLYSNLCKAWIYYTRKILWIIWQEVW